MSVTLTKREIELLRILSEANSYVETAVICEKMDVKPRTLRECIRIFRDGSASQCGVDIEAKGGFGYRLKITDQTKYYALLRDVMDQETNSQFLMPSDQNERINYIIRMLLTSSGYQKSEDLADRMYISRSTFSEDLRQVKEQLALFDLQVESAGRMGIRISGDEFHIRNAIAEFCFDSTGFDAKKVQNKANRYFGDDEFERMKDLLYEVLKENDFTMSDASFRNLIIHLLIAQTRIRSGTYINTISSGQEESLKEKREWQIASELYERLSALTGLDIPEAEIGYVTIHLLGKRMIASEKEMVLYPETLNTLMAVMNQILERYGYDFSGDIELFGALAMHMEPLIERAKYGLHINNPLLTEINQENPLAFDIAVRTAKILEEQIGCSIDENEIGYLALHFALSIERQKKPLKKRIVVVCASGAGTSRMLAYRIRKRFGESCETVDTMSYFDLQKAAKCDYDLVLTTVPLYFSLDVPVIRIREIPDENDMEKVEMALNNDPDEFRYLVSCFEPDLIFAGMDLRTPDEVIDFLSQKMAERIRIDDDFVRLVKERERLASTAIGHLVAFPHPARSTSDVTRVAVLSLRKPVEWYGSKVQLVFLTSIQRNGDEKYSLFAETMARLVMNRQLLNRLMKELTYEQLLNCVQSLYHQPQEEDIFQ